jgi:hypothetical protein
MPRIGEVLKYKCAAAAAAPQPPSLNTTRNDLCSPTHVAAIVRALSPMLSTNPSMELQCLPLVLTRARVPAFRIMLLQNAGQHASSCNGTPGASKRNRPWHEATGRLHGLHFVDHRVVRGR